MRVFLAVCFGLILGTSAQARIVALPPCAPSIACSQQSVVSVLPDWPRNAKRSEEPEGSGIVVHDGTLIATADHVLGSATKVRIRTTDGQISNAEIVLRDAETDIALLKIDGKLLQLSKATSKTGLPEPSDKVCAIGNAFGLDISLTCGVISAVNVSGTGFNQIEDFVQTDAAVNPGMSGGALVDEHGQLVGMLSAIFTKKSDSNIGVNFAVSQQLLHRVIYDFLDNGKVDRPRPGILVRPARDGIGGEIARVVDGSAEARAGLRAGDVLLEVDGRRFVRAGLYRRALAFVADRPPLRVTVRRGEDTRELVINFSD